MNATKWPRECYERGTRQCQSRRLNSQVRKNFVGNGSYCTVAVGKSPPIARPPRTVSSARRVSYSGPLLPRPRAALPSPVLPLARAASNAERTSSKANTLCKPHHHLREGSGSTRATRCIGDTPRRSPGPAATASTHCWCVTSLRKGELLL